MFNPLINFCSTKALIGKYLSRHSLDLSNEMEAYFRKESYAEGDVYLDKKLTLKDGRSTVEIEGMIESHRDPVDQANTGNALFYKLRSAFHKFSCGYFEYLDKTIGPDLKAALVEHSKTKDKDVLYKDKISMINLMNEVSDDYSVFFLAEEKIEAERKTKEEEEKKRDKEIAYNSAKPTEKTQSALDKYRNSDIRDTVEALREQMKS